MSIWFPLIYNIIILIWERKVKNFDYLESSPDTGNFSDLELFVQPTSTNVSLLSVHQPFCQAEIHSPQMHSSMGKGLHGTEPQQLQTRCVRSKGYPEKRIKPLKIKEVLLNIKNVIEKAKGTLNCQDYIGKEREEREARHLFY